MPLLEGTNWLCVEIRMLFPSEKFDTNDALRQKQANNQYTVVFWKLGIKLTKMEKKIELEVFFFYPGDLLAKQQESLFQLFVV